MLKAAPHAGVEGASLARKSSKSCTAWVKRNSRCAGQEIRLRGKNMTENEHVKLGAYHTLEIEQQRAFTIYKQSWDALDLERIQQACDPAASADLAAVLITASSSPVHVHALPVTCMPASSNRMLSLCVFHNVYKHVTLHGRMWIANRRPASEGHASEQAYNCVLGIPCDAHAINVCIQSSYT